MTCLPKTNPALKVKHRFLKQVLLLLCVDTLTAQAYAHSHHTPIHTPTHELPSADALSDEGLGKDLGSLDSLDSPDGLGDGLGDGLKSDKTPLPINALTAHQTNESQPAPPSVDVNFLLAQPEAFYHVFHQAIVQDDVATLRLLLPFYDRLPDDYQDDVLLLFAQSKLALSDGNTKLALNLLTDLSNKEPTLTAVKLQLASLLLTNKHDKHAQMVLDELKDDAHFLKLSKKEQRWVLSQSRHLHKKYKMGLDLGINYLHLDNINAASTITQPNIKKDAPKPAHGLALSLGVNKYTPLSHGMSIYTALDVDGKFYDDKSHNELAVFAHAGLRKDHQKGYVDVVPFVGRIFATNQQHGRLSPRKDSQGVAFGSHHRINDKWQNAFFARMEKGNYTERYQGYDGKRYHVNDTILLQDGPNRRYSLGVGYQLSHLQDATKSSHATKIHFGVLQRLPNGLTVQGRVSAERERYHGKLLRLVNPDDVYRTDKTLTLQTSIWHKDIHWLGLTPKLTYRYSKNNSNLPALYSHNKQNFYLELGRSF
ncbi:surface lipoprotein assembly modifier [Moraxella catarrhalis]|uniref:surface lipoprotein assembly modifier n=2 Tax=Moraxella catarrhalis TaxID=480 RepID=UPI000202AEA7|nr:surface lipoprotein assembly modifier [Moraxella catarrhalis]EGE13298.1 hypothetical protein E9K_06177 [Moraxella catarrhalis 103P14B1]EGE22338.1 hypothetical protein E9S_00645 [Moraxella catarrhalis BC7]EGE27196.1 hypothetical protein E9Y_00353 [Moraxella catarrhalis 101P30B1]MPW56371.1 DUF560 domain-containing protein [Moraxella catarrhalis]MPW60549.1 DUF560 domain-containing protein [Moraxella catarrhalis]